MQSNCQKCHGEIDADAEKCKHCGYEPSDLGIGATIYVILAILLCLTGVGAIVGLPMLFFAYRGYRKAEDYRPSNHTP